MKIINNSEEYELAFYTKIINYFQKGNLEFRNTEIWRSKAIIELMELFKRTRNRKFVTNALIILISLFEDTSPDVYDNLGKNINQISKEEKTILMTELKDEFLPN